jgi:hypothetical protein
MSSVVFYTAASSLSVDINGNNILAEDGPNAYAKQIIEDNGTKKFMIRVDSCHKFINPFDYDDKTEFNRHQNFVNKTCKTYTENRYVRVNEKCFDYYLSFLRSKNKAKLLNAQREAM